MACKNDDGWPEGGSFTQIGQCIDWPKLVQVRESWNKVWEYLKREERAPEYRYGWGSSSGSQYAPSSWNTGCKNRREEIEDLADIRGYISIRLDYYGNIDAVAFVIDGGSILGRLSRQGSACSSQSCGGCAGQESLYEYNPGTNRGMGQWAAYLKDPCHGCTAFQLSHVCDVRKEDIVYQTAILDVIEDYYGKGPNTACPINRHWQWLYNPNSPGVLQGYPNICNVAVEWRAQGMPIFQSALSLFPAKQKCADEQDPYTSIVQSCCGVNAIAHWTEEWDPADQGSAYYQCPKDEIIPGALAPGNIRRFCKRRIKYIDLYHGFYGDVTQIIRARHLNHIWGMFSGLSQTLRKCSENKCEFKQSNDKKDTWVYKDWVPFRGTEKSLDVRDAGGKCDKCEQPAGGQSICSCEWDDLKHFLDAEMKPVGCLDEWRSTVKGPRKGDGDPYLQYGEIDGAPTECSACKGKCCYDCKCEDMTENDCMNIKEVRKLKKDPEIGPMWMGVYGQQTGTIIDDGCTGCKKRGQPRPCNAWEKGDTHDPEMTYFEMCGAKSACYNMQYEIDYDTLEQQGDYICLESEEGKECRADECKCCCETVTKCQCDAMEGEWLVPPLQYLKDGKSLTCADLCKEPSTCKENMCEGTYELKSDKTTLASGKYCQGCYDGLDKWYYGTCEDDNTVYELKKTQCGKTTTVQSWTSSCDNLVKIEPPGDGLCTDANDGPEKNLTVYVEMDA